MHYLEVPKDDEEAKDTFVKSLSDKEFRLYHAYRKLGRISWELEIERYKARHDSLTGLANRRAFLERMADYPSTHRGILFLDADRFKETNDILGHGKGDEVLQGITDRITTVLRDSDIVDFVPSRYGGDEFAILVDLTPVKEETGKRTEESLSDEARLRNIEARLGETFNQYAQEDPAFNGVSVGAMLWPLGMSGKEALSRVDRLMYEQKQTRQNI
jgi:diguanylate cyclase (GGDEF)-like protein